VITTKKIEKKVPKEIIEIIITVITTKKIARKVPIIKKIITKKTARKVPIIKKIITKNVETVPIIVRIVPKNITRTITKKREKITKIITRRRTPKKIKRITRRKENENDEKRNLIAKRVPKDTDMVHLRHLLWTDLIFGVYDRHRYRKHHHNLNLMMNHPKKSHHARVLQGPPPLELYLRDPHLLVWRK